MNKKPVYALAFALVILSTPSCVKIHDCSCHIIDNTIPSRTEERDEVTEIPGTKKFAETECGRRQDRMRELYDEGSTCQLK